MKPPKPIKSRSSKKQAQMRRATAQIKRLVEVRGNRCEVCPLIHRVTKPADWWFCAGVEGRHHLRKQSQTTNDDDDNVLLSCNRANLWVEDHPVLALDAGLVIR